MASNQLSPRGAILMGIVFVLAGLPPMLIGMGVITPSGGDAGSPPWVVICAGLMFVVAGLTIVLDFAVAGGVGPDGDLRAGTPFAIRVANFLCGMTIVGLMTSVFGWVAFGSGPRRFSTTMSLPFLAQSWASGETSGRVAFGIATVLMALMFVACTVVGVERLWRARRG